MNEETDAGFMGTWGSLTIRLHEMYDFTSQQAPPSSAEYSSLLLERGIVELCVHLTLVDTIGSMVDVNCHKSWLQVGAQALQVRC